MNAAFLQSLANDPKTLHLRFPQLGESSACSVCKAPSDIEKKGTFTRPEPMPCKPGGAVVCLTCAIDHPTIHQYLREMRAPFEKQHQADRQRESHEKSAEEAAAKRRAQDEAENEAQKAQLRQKLSQLV